METASLSEMGVWAGLAGFHWTTEQHMREVVCGDTDLPWVERMGMYKSLINSSQ